MRSRRIQRLETDEADILLETNAEHFSLETTKLISRSRPMKLPSQPDGTRHHTRSRQVPIIKSHEVMGQLQSLLQHQRTLRHSLSEMRILYETRRSQSPKNMSRPDTQLTKIERADSTAANYANLPRRALTPLNVSGATIPDHSTSWVRTRQNDRSSGNDLIARSNTSGQISPLLTAQTPEEDDELRCALATPIDKPQSKGTQSTNKYI
ncbi:hypothetical protein F2Q70_00011346 [Brassica cretica]|nr:hypothetical protein F2Q70_00011346 [Brassica cretica]KAF3551465.1 hypothetical protein DY000_02006558 [Brassica cretica]